MVGPESALCQGHLNLVGGGITGKLRHFSPKVAVVPCLPLSQLLLSDGEQILRTGGEDDDDDEKWRVLPGFPFVLSIRPRRTRSRPSLSLSADLSIRQKSTAGVCPGACAPGFSLGGDAAAPGVCRDLDLLQRQIRSPINATRTGPKLRKGPEDGFGPVRFHWTSILIS